MSQHSNNQYLDSKILTSSQPQLHLILLDGAFRFCRKAKDLWGDDENADVLEHLLGRAAEIVDELTRGAAAGSEEVSEQLEEQYAFIYRELAACRINQSEEKLDSCLKLLEYERETWVLACKKHEEEMAKPHPNKMPHLHMDSMPTSEGFSIEA